ncbi:hypothetical protein B11253_14610 [Campylobacter jejuni]|nr:hypothetical protein [Campylobacter jejuni]BEK23162.1 hypothetical protein B11253_14610 [Campylobacter jejuni]
MHNPNSAIERVKNHLAYKLGQAMIDFTNSSSGGYIALFKNFIKLKNNTKKNKKFINKPYKFFLNSNIQV